jgi:hypothetical protein
MSHRCPPRASSHALRNIEPSKIALFLETTRIFWKKKLYARHLISFVAFNPHCNLIRNVYECFSLCLSLVSLHFKNICKDISLTCHIPISSSQPSKLFRISGCWTSFACFGSQESSEIFSSLFLFFINIYLFIYLFWQYWGFKLSKGP